jgi:putative inorganic carbon (HCO3(-)) transporter
MTGSLTIANVPRSPAALTALVVGYVALLPFQFEVWRGSLNFAPADCLLVLVLLLAAAQLRYNPQVWSGWHYGLALVFVIGSLVASLRFGKLEPYELFNKDAGLILPFLSYAAITSAIVEWEDLRHILRVFAWSVVAQNILAVIAFFVAYFYGVPNPFARYGGMRLSGMLLDPNAYGGLLVMALVVVEGASWGPTPLFGEKALWISRLSLGLGILFTFSRSAWVALALALLVLGVLRFWVAGRLVLAGLAAVPCLVLFMGKRFLPIFEVMPTWRFRSIPSSAAESAAFG